MATAREFCSLALQEIGVLAAGETADAANMAFAFTRFQQQLNSWQADGNALAVQNRLTYTLPSGENTATIGPVGGDITAQRPVFVRGVNYLIPGSTPPVETPMGPMDDDQYMALSIKTLESQLPTLYFYQSSVDSVLGTFFFWPTVTQNVEIAIYVAVGVGEPATLTSTVQGPPGYAEAFLYDLAYRLCTPFGRPVPPLLPQMRSEAIGRMKRQNVQPGLMGVDQALIGGYAGGYNVLSDTTTGPSNR